MYIVYKCENNIYHNHDNKINHLHYYRIKKLSKNKI